MVYQDFNQIENQAKSNDLEIKRVHVKLMVSALHDFMFKNCLMGRLIFVTYTIMHIV